MIKKIEELRRKIEKIKIVFDSSNPEIYGVYSRENQSINLNNEQFQDEFTALVYYVHELLYAIDDRGKSVGYQVDSVFFVDEFKGKTSSGPISYIEELESMIYTGEVQDTDPKII